MGSHVNYGGLVVAGVGFLLTRFTVTLALYEDPVRFYLAGVVPLALGLGLAAFGVALAVADVETSLVRTTATWCVVGAATMLVLVVLTLFGSGSGGLPDLTAVRSRTYLSNFLIGGSVGGTLTGLYAARTRRQRVELRRQANLLAVLNRMLRHEVLNAVTAIRGYAALDRDGDRRPGQVIVARSDAIERAIEEVKYLARSADRDGPSTVTTALGEHLSESAARVRDRHPEVDLSLDPVPDGLAVRADDRLGRVFTHLLSNAAVHGRSDAPTVDVSVRTTARTVRVSVRDEGPGLPERQRALLETGVIEEYDDPGAGFGLNVVRLLVENYGGTIETTVDEDGTTVTVVLSRTDEGVPGLRLDGVDPASVRPSAPDLLVILGAAAVAGVVYGVASEALGGSVAGIGVFYGTADPVVGWLTHEFHSVVFGFAFGGLLTVVPDRYRVGLPTHVAVGAAWGAVLWVVAAGLVAPGWLRLLGIPAPIPNLPPTLLATHLVWGIALGLLTAWGDRHVRPWLDRASVRVGDAVAARR